MTASAREPRRWPESPGAFVDPARCPDCWSALTGPVCRVCGLDLSVPDAHRLLELGRRLLDVETERRSVIAGLRRAQDARERAVLAGAPAPAGVVHATAAAPSPPRQAPEPSRVAVAQPAGPRAEAPPVPQPSAAGGTRSGRSPVQAALLVLGVALLGIAAVFFLFVAYLLTGAAVRAALTAGLGVAALAAGWVLAVRRLRGTAEAVTAVGALVLVLDAAYVRAAGVFETEGVPPLVWAGGAAVLLAALLYGSARLTGLATGRWSALVLFPAGVGLLGAAVADAAGSEWSVQLAVGGAVAAAGCLAEAGADRPAERATTRMLGVIAAAVALLAAIPSGAVGVRIAALLLLAAAGVVFALRRRRAGAAPGELGAAGAIAGLAITAASTIAAFGFLVAPADRVVAAFASGLVGVLAARAARSRDERLRRAILGLGAGSLVPLAGLGALAASTALWSALRRLSDPAFADEALEPHRFAAAVVLGVAALALVAVLGGLGVARAVIPAAVGGAGLVAVSVAALWPDPVLPLLLALATAALAAVVIALRRASTATRTTALAAGTTAWAFAWALAERAESPQPWAAGIGGAILVAGLLRALAGAVAPRIGAVASAAAVAVLLVGLAEAPTRFPAGATAGGDWIDGRLWSGAAAAVIVAVAALLVRRGPARRDGLAVLVPAAVALAAVIATDPLVHRAPLPGAVLTTLAAAALACWLQAPHTSGGKPGSPSALRAASAALVPALSAWAAARWADLPASFPLDAGPRMLLAAAAVLLVCSALTVPLLGRTGSATAAWLSSTAVTGVVIATGALVQPDGAGWSVLLVLAPVPLLVAASGGHPLRTVGNRRAGASWASVPLLLASLVLLLTANRVESAEAYTASTAAVLAATAAALTRWGDRPGPDASGLRPLPSTVLAAAAAVLVLPSVALAAEAPSLRAVLLVVLGGLALLGSPFLPERTAGLPLRALAGAGGALAAVGGGAVRGLGDAFDGTAVLPEAWLLPGIVCTGIAAFAWVAAAARPVGAAAVVLGVLLPLAAAVVLAAAADAAAEPRIALLLLALGAVHVLGTAVGRAPLTRGLGRTALVVQAVAAVLALVALRPVPFELVTVPFALTLLAAGAIRMRRDAAVRSMPALGPGLLVLLAPSLVADWFDPQLWRIVAVGAAGLVVLVLGVVARLQAPFVVGLVVVAVHALVQLWPWIVELTRPIEWWLWLGIAGALLIAIAARYERRVRDARAVALRIAALR